MRAFVRFVSGRAQRASGVFAMLIAVATVVLCGLPVSDAIDSSIVAAAPSQLIVPDCFTPEQWIPKLGSKWNRDADSTNVEDDIEAMNLGDTISVILDLNGCPSDSDLSRFANFGTVKFVGQYLSIMALSNVTVADAISLGQDGRVAMVELERTFTTTLDKSVPTIRVRSGVYSPNTVEDNCNSTNGSGVSIAILDTGVDDMDGLGLTHQSLPASRFVGGFTCTNGLCSQGNPDDDIGHGTHVAGIALGGTVVPHRGVATGAGLVDIKLFGAGLTSQGSDVSAALQATINQKSAWNIGVVNMSLGNCIHSNGLDAVSQYVNVAVSHGLVVVVAMGNTGNCGFSCTPTNLVPEPGAADHAITVGASSYQSTQSRTDDVVACFSFRGPRPSDKDADTEDELKPSVVAPGTDSDPAGLGVSSAQMDNGSGYVRMPGTSMAAPHVAGLAALIMQSHPGIHPLAVRQMIIDMANSSPFQPLADGTPTGWNPHWGNGLVDGFVCNSTPRQSGTVTGVKFNDLNGNGINDGEPGLQGWTIRFTDVYGNLVSTVVTGLGGTYTTNIYPPGIYTVSEVAHSAWSQSFPQFNTGKLTHTVNVQAGQTISGVNFGNWQPCNLTTQSINISTGWDNASNSVLSLSPGERDLDWIVITDPFHPNLPPSTQCNGQTTEPRPSYVVPNCCWATEFGGSRWITSNLSSLNGCNGTYIYQYSFCLDANFDGVQLMGQFRADDSARVFLNGSLLPKTPPLGCPPVSGSPSGCSHTTACVCGFNTTDQSLFRAGLNHVTVLVRNTMSGWTSLNLTGTITASQGLYSNLCCSPSSILGVKWNDLDCDGQKDANEVPVSNPPGPAWNITVSGPTNLSTTTDSWGNYAFPVLPPGTYTVSEDAHGSWLPCAPPSGIYSNVTLQPGQIATLNFFNKSYPCYTNTLLLNTGYDDQNGVAFTPPGPGESLPDDSWWVIRDPQCPIASCNRPASVVNRHAAWAAPATNSQWVVAEETDNFAAQPGISEFQFCFCLAANPSNVALTIGGLVDDEADVFLNGDPAPILRLDSYTIPKSVSITDQSKFLPGRNCIRVVVTNVVGPTGINITGSVTQANQPGVGTTACCDPCSISGKKFFDTDHNGQQNGSEPDLEDWTITLNWGGGRVYSATTTNADGEYVFNDIPCSAWEISEEIPQPWVQTLPGEPGIYSMLFPFGPGSATGVDFGNEACIPPFGDCLNCAPPPYEMVLWLPFDEIIGPKADNVCGGNDGTHVNSPVVTSDGVVGNALCFDGAMTHVIVNSHSAIDINTNDFSIDAWIKRSPGDAGIRVIAEKRLGQNKGYSLYLDNGQLACQLADASGFQNYGSGVIIPSGEWQHVAVTIDRDDQFGGQFYLNGDPAGLTFSPLAHQQSLGNDEPLVIGATNSTSSVFLGCIDEVEIFRRELGPEEIEAIHDGGYKGKCKNYCMVSHEGIFCKENSTITVSPQVCNATTDDRNYECRFVTKGLGDPGCTITGPTYFNPNPIQVSVRKGECEYIPTAINRPGGMNADGLVGCYQLECTDLATGEIYTCDGSIVDRRKWCVRLPYDATVGEYTDTVGGGLTTNSILNPVNFGPITVTNSDSIHGTLNYQIIVMNDEMNQDTYAVSLNGLPPGTPVTGSLTLGPNASATVDLNAEFKVYNPLHWYTILVQADVDGDSIMDPLASAGFRNIIVSTDCVCPCFADPQCDGVRSDILDVIQTVNVAFRNVSPTVDPICPNERTDVDCNGFTDVVDIVKVVNVAFRNANAATEYCDPCP